MRISDWSSDVCSSDLDRNVEARRAEVDHVTRIVDEEAVKFGLWSDTQRVQPTITELAARAEALRVDVIEKTLRSNGVSQRSEERRVWEGCGVTGSSRWSPLQ